MVHKTWHCPQGSCSLNSSTCPNRLPLYIPISVNVWPLNPANSMSASSPTISVSSAFFHAFICQLHLNYYFSFLNAFRTCFPLGFSIYTCQYKFEHIISCLKTIELQFFFCRVRSILLHMLPKALPDEVLTYLCHLVPYLSTPENCSPHFSHSHFMFP